MQVEDVQVDEVFQVLDPFDSILAQHEHPQVDELTEPTDSFDSIVVQVEKDEAFHLIEILNVSNKVAADS